MADYSVTAANVLLVSGGSPQVATAGENMTAGMPFYKDTSDSNKGKKSDANASGKNTIDGVVLSNTVSTNQTFTYAPPGAVINLGTTMTVGELVILSNTSGSFCPSSDAATGQNITLGGIALTASNLWLQCIASGVPRG